MLKTKNPILSFFLKLLFSFILERKMNLNRTMQLVGRPIGTPSNLNNCNYDQNLLLILRFEKKDLKKIYYFNKCEGIHRHSSK